MLKCNLVEPKEMFKYRWYVPKDHNNWYYFTPKKESDLFLDIKPELIYKTLDKSIKKIFLFLLQNNLRTLPSCEGHFHSREEIKKKYQSLLNDVSKIKNNKFSIKDLESLKNYNYHNKNYSLPWDSYQSFQNNIEETMNNGYLGILNCKNLSPITMGPIKITDQNIGDNCITHISVDNFCQEDVSKNWNDVFSFLKEKFKSN